MDKTQTITITNFGGRLTRLLNGDLNSGFAKFTQSFGYDPFSKPMNLTWLEQPNNITGPITDLPLAAKNRFESNHQYTYVIGSTGNLYKIDPNPIFGNSSILTADSVIGIASVKSGTSYNYGASMEFYGNSEKIFIGHDNGVNSINFNGTAEAKIGNQGNYVSSTIRPLRQFVGGLLFGNGPTIGKIDVTGTVTSSVIGMGIRQTISSVYSELNPPLGPEDTVLDLDVSPDFNYALISASEIPAEDILTSLSDRNAAAASNGYVFKWNGSDPATTSGVSIPSFAITALQTYLQNNYLFSNDLFGSSMGDTGQKIVSLINNKSPFPNATGVNGNFLFWVAPEIPTTATKRVASLYYFGSLDQENPPGLYRLLRYDPFPALNYQSPLCFITNNTFTSLNNSTSSVATISYGKHYFSTYDINNGTAAYKLQSFYVSPTGFGSPMGGVYETQTQLFSKKISVKQIRVYTEPTATGNAFQLFPIGADGTRISSNVLSYTYDGSGTDITKLQGALTRIDFSGETIQPTYALGINITNTGTTNMTIKKIEIDYQETGK